VLVIVVGRWRHIICTGGCFLTQHRLLRLGASPPTNRYFPAKLDSSDAKLAAQPARRLLLLKFVFNQDLFYVRLLLIGWELLLSLLGLSPDLLS
jgi:hypothetical protein